TYLVVGLAGMPWFAGATGGPAALLKPSFGYIIGFVFAAALVGWLAERTWDRRPMLAMAGFLLASLVPFLFGVPYLAWMVGTTDLAQALSYGFTPFIVGGIVKAGVAAVLFPVAWSLVRRADSGKE
ncbi:MAG: biotin transporter BioY, partial [Ornithinimicrobium sp.]